MNADDISRLYDGHAEALLAFFVSRTYHPEAAVDLVGETFAAAFEDRRQFRGTNDGEARGWLFGIARHQLTDYFRRGQVERRALARLGVDRRALSDGEYDRIEELAACEDLRTQVAQQLGRLAPEQQDVLRLRVLQERPYPDVARALGITEQTARARVSRALRSLRTSLVLNDLQEIPEHA